ncbi:MAG: hypothetical protein RL134_1348 [Actinomycetota bacterium]
MRDFQATFGDLVIDVLAWEARLDGRVLDLTRTEFQILSTLVSRPRQVFTDEELIRAIWGDGWFGDENNLAVHVSKLRHKLGESGLHPRYIRTVRGVGYRFDPGSDYPRLTASAPARSCEILRGHPGAVEVLTDAQLRVREVRPGGSGVLGYDDRRLVGCYFPIVATHPWNDHASALEAVQVLVASGVREWTARHIVRRADGTVTRADVATCLAISGDGSLESVCFVLVAGDATVTSGGGLTA